MIARICKLRAIAVCMLICTTSFTRGTDLDHFSKPEGILCNASFAKLATSPAGLGVLRLERALSFLRHYAVTARALAQ